MEKNQMDGRIQSNMWRWWCGGGVISVAVVLGCATAVDFKSSGREAGAPPAEANAPSAKVKRGVAAAPGYEVPHNGGKVRMPVTASFDGEPEVTVSQDKNITISISADGDIKSVRGVVEGSEGLEGVRQPLTFSEIATGETKYETVWVSAKSGTLIVRIEGDVGGSMMTANLELHVRNPKEVKAKSAAKPRATDMTGTVSRDATGQVVESMRASP